MQLAILPPQNLFLPFLMYRTKSDKSVLTLCAKCSNIESSKPCTHNDNERCLVGTYMINEIEYALSLGYKILKIYECHVYFRQRFIFKKFITLLNYFRTQNSNCLSNLSYLDQQNMCTDLTERLQLPSTLVLKPENVQFNPANYALYKLAMNSVFGKFQQKQNLLKSFYVANQNELEEQYFKHSENIQNIASLNNSILRLVIKESENDLIPNRKTNCYLGAQLVSFARQHLHEQLSKLDATTCQLFYFDTDSIFFSTNESSFQNPFLISSCLGDFKDVVNGEILNFYSFGPKNYIFRYKDSKTSKINEIIKVRGLCLKSNSINLALDSKLYEDYLNDFLKNIVQKKPILNLKNNALNPYTFNNLPRLNRNLNKLNMYLTTTPKGYLKDNS